MTSYVIPPANTPVDETDLVITAGMLIDSPVAEPDGTAGEVAWSGSTDYASGDQVISTTTHRTYECLSGSRAPVTISNANPAVVAWSAHDLIPNTPVVFSTTGTLPTGVTAGTIYYVHTVPNLDSFTLKDTLAGTQIATSTAGAGTHTGIATPNRNHDPSTDTAADWWADVGPTNRYKMFDLLRNSRTVFPSPFTVVVAPGKRADAIGLVGLIADSVEISVESPSAGVDPYVFTADLLQRYPTNWYEWTVQEFYQVGSTATFDVPPYVDNVMTFTFTRATGDVEVGGIIMGLKIRLGEAEIGSEIDAQNFSQVTRDRFGNAKFDRQRNVPVVRQQIWCKDSDVNRLRIAKDALNGVPAFWVMLDDPTHPYFEITSVVGAYSRWGIPLEYHHHVPQQLEITEI